VSPICSRAFVDVILRWEGSSSESTPVRAGLVSAEIAPARSFIRRFLEDTLVRIRPDDSIFGSIIDVAAILELRRGLEAISFGPFCPMVLLSKGDGYSIERDLSTRDENARTKTNV
jgi:hypothetical protein